mgnify:CR=1 FL=1
MDDIFLIGNDIEFLNSTKGYLNKNFFNEKTSVKLLMYWATRSIEIDRDA